MNKLSHIGYAAGNLDRQLLARGRAQREMMDQPEIIIDEDYRYLKHYVMAQKVIESLLAGTPQKYLAGLKSIVLTDASSLNRDRKRQKTLWRKKKVAIRECNGLYHQEWQGKPAWIEIFVENTVRNWPSWLLRLSFYRDMAFAKVLFHEIGHHIHYTQEPEHREREEVAERWQERLTHDFFTRKYWYIALPIRFFALLINKLRHFFSRRSNLRSP